MLVTHERKSSNCVVKTNFYRDKNKLVSVTTEDGLWMVRHKPRSRHHLTEGQVGLEAKLASNVVSFETKRGSSMSL